MQERGVPRNHAKLRDVLVKILASGAVAVISLSLVVGAGSPAFAAPVSVVVDGMTFEADDANVAAGATVTGYTPGSTDVAVPSSVDISGQIYEVTAIGGGAFFGKGLTSVSLPNTLTAIGDNAFRGNSLTTVAIPFGVSAISLGSFAFNDLTSVSIPGSVTVIRDSAFAANNLASIDIPLGVGTIEQAAFQSNNLTTVNLSTTVSVIGISAFRDNQLTSVTIPGSVTSIGASAFHINPLTSVVMLGGAPAVGGEFHFGTANPLVTYPWRYGSPPAVDGYTSPTWQGYRSQAVAQVEFDTAGGSPAPGRQPVNVGSMVIKPADPVRDGFEFDGWFTQASGGVEWGFSQNLTVASLSSSGASDLTLVARWSATTLAETGMNTGPALGFGVLLLLAGAAMVGFRMRARSA